MVIVPIFPHNSFSYPSLPNLLFLRVVNNFPIHNRYLTTIHLRLKLRLLLSRLLIRHTFHIETKFPKQNPRNVREVIPLPTQTIIYNILLVR